MKHDLHDYIKIFLENKKVTIVLLIALFPALGGHLYGLLDVPAKPVKVAEKAPVPAIRVIEEPYPEIVTPTYKPHTHPEILDKIKAHQSGPLH